jgi:micrococcal nuclease
MKKNLLFIIFIILGACGLSADAPPPHPASIDLSRYAGNFPDYFGVVERVADGDTFTLEFYGVTKSVRIKGIDTPETSHPRKPAQYWGEESANYLKSLLTKGRIIRLSFEGNFIDSFGRLLAYVWYHDGSRWVLLQKEMLEKGHAVVYIEYFFERPLEFLRYQERAIKNRAGIWARPEKIENEHVKSRDEFYRRKAWFRAWADGGKEGPPLGGG